MSGGLQQIVAHRILNDMLKCETVRKKDKQDWKVLVMDILATKIISASCKMHDIMSEGVTIVEDVAKNREPLPQLEAIYFVTPDETSISQVIHDFERANEPLYRAAHIFFTEACPNDQFKRLSQSRVVPYTKSLRELNIAFIPYERQVFTLDSPETFNILYNPIHSQERPTHLEKLAEQIATLCATLQEYPNIRYRSDFIRNTEFAHILQSKLDQYKAEDPSMGEGPDKSKSTLLILDRGFDAVTPLLHELTFQAMAYDLLPIVDDVYRYYSTTGADHPTQKEALLNETDDLWLELRHQHIAIVSQLVTKKLKEFAVQKRLKDGEKTTIKDLSQMVKKMPQYQKEINAYSLHLHLAEDCMKQYQGKLDKICIVEQNLVMGTDPEGEKIKDHMKYIVPILLDNTVSVEDKLRVIMLYILHKNGISDENLDKLLGHAMIPMEKKSIITALQMLNLQIIQDASWLESPTTDHRSTVDLAAGLFRKCSTVRKKNIPTNRKERNEPVFHTSRWTPYVKDLMEDAIDDKLDSRMFPFLGQRAGGLVSSTREYGGWHRGRNQMFSRSGPRLIVFILGGVTYSEMRCAYEVTVPSKKWEVIIGSDHIITPHQFLKDLEMKSELPHTEEKLNV